MKRRLLFIFLMVSLSLVSGCWSRRELTDLAIVLGVGIDKAKDQYLISTQIVNVGAAAEKTTGRADVAPVTTFSIKAHTILEGIRSLTTVTPRRLYPAHMRVLVIGEAVAREGIRNVLDQFLRENEIRPDFYVIVAKDTTAQNIMSIFTALEKIPSNKLFKSLELSERAWAPTVGVLLDEFITALVSDEREPVLTGLEIAGDVQTGSTESNVSTIKPPTLLRYSSIGVFKEDKLIGWLNQMESQGYNYIVDNVTGTSSEVNCENGGKLNIEIIRSKTRVKGNVLRGKPEIYISINAEGNIGEVACKIDLSKTKSIYELESKIEQRIKTLVEMAVHKAQKQYKSDVFGFGEAIHRGAPQAWKTLKKNWEKEFPNVQVHVMADVKIRRTGKVGNSFLHKLKER